MNEVATIEEPTTELVKIDQANLPDIFKPGGTEPLISALQREVDARKDTFDISTPKGRKEIASFNYKLARTKTGVDAIAKRGIAAEKAKIKLWDTERGRFWDAVEKMQSSVTKDLDAWEATEKKRIADHQSEIDDIKQLRANFPGETSALILENIDYMAKWANRDWQEFVLKATAELK